jgi:hypothetical protein
MTEAATAVARRDADAVRYIVLRKLASGLRHTLMGELQSIQFLAELSARHMGAGGAGAGVADPVKARDCVGKISAATSGAIATCHSVIDWLRPDAKATTTLGDAVGQCVKLAGDDWRMRATQATIALAGAAGAAKVSKAVARELVVVSLLTLTDQHPGSLDIEVTGALAGDHVALRMRASIAARASPLPAATIYQPLDWSDVEVLAAAQGVECICVDGAVTLSFPASPPD